MYFSCKKCGSKKLNITSFVDYTNYMSSLNLSDSWRLSFNCPICGYEGDDANVESDFCTSESDIHVK